MTADWEAKYRESRPTYERLMEEAIFALDHAIGAAGIRLHSLTGRVKTLESLQEKVERRSYTQPLEQAPDLVGARVVVLFMSDLARVDTIVGREFEILRTEDKVEGEVDPTTFGYMSRHFDVRMPAAHHGPRYEGIRDINFEVQVRTLLMDAWANVSHFLAYKGEASIPVELRRDFHALSGLFYVADKHFELFFGKSIELREETEKRLATDPGRVDLNLDTLGAFLEQRFADREHSDRAVLAEMADELLRFGYKSIGDVEEMLDESQDIFDKYEKENPPYGEEGAQFLDVGVVRISLRKVNPSYATYLKSKAFDWEDDEEGEPGDSLADPVA
jgi:putative GTP pyrophosphokinase